MQKTESSNKTVNVIDEYGNKLEATYPKRAKGLIKSGRARYVDENTILLITNLPNNNNLEEHKMNNNENRTINQEYIINKIDEIIKMNQDALLRTDLAEFSNVPGTKNPIQSLCETNNKMIDFLREIYVSTMPKAEPLNDKILAGYMAALQRAVEEGEEGVVDSITEAINELSFRNK